MSLTSYQTAPPRGKLIAFTNKIKCVKYNIFVGLNIILKENQIIKCIDKLNNKSFKLKVSQKYYFGNGKSDKMFLNILKKNQLWKIPKQKQFQDYN